MRKLTPGKSTILVIASGDVYGGAERQILATSSWYRRHGHQLLVLLFYDGELRSRLEARGVAVNVIGKQRLIDLAAIREIHDIISSLQPDGIHIHGYRAAAYLYAAGNVHNANIVKTEHGFPETGQSVLERAKLGLYRFVENFSVRRLGATIVYVTEELCERSRESHHGIDSAVIHNGVDLSDLDTAFTNVPLPEDKTNLVIVGRVDTVKGIRFAIDMLANEKPGDHVCCYVIGEGPLRASLQEYAARLGVDDRVEFLGFRDDVYSYIKHADALLMPSLHEGLPYAVLEACVLGTPVIASRVGGLAEVFEDRKNAYLFDVGDTAGMCRAITEMIESPAQREALIAEARRLVADKLNADVMGRRYAELLSGETTPAQD